MSPHGSALVIEMHHTCPHISGLQRSGDKMQITL